MTAKRLRFDYSEITTGLFDVVPGVIDLAHRTNRRKVVTCSGGQMTIGVRVIARGVCARAVLTEDIAREVPLEVSVLSGYARVGSTSDNSSAVLHCVLEHERDTGAGHVPSSLEERVNARVGELANLRTLEVRKVVVQIVDDNGAISCCSRPEARRRHAANGLRETEREECDTSHEHEDDAQRAHLLAGSMLLFG